MPEEFEFHKKRIEMPMTIRPLYDRIVVQRAEKRQAMLGGLHIPDFAQEKPHEAEVIEVGKGKRLEDGKLMPLHVKVGDRVLLGKYAGYHSGAGDISRGREERSDGGQAGGTGSNGYSRHHRNPEGEAR